MDIAIHNISSKYQSPFKNTIAIPVKKTFYFNEKKEDFWFDCEDKDR